MICYGINDEESGAAETRAPGESLAEMTALHPYVIADGR